MKGVSISVQTFNPLNPYPPHVFSSDLIFSEFFFFRGLYILRFFLHFFHYFFQKIFSSQKVGGGRGKGDIAPMFPLPVCAPAPPSSPTSHSNPDRQKCLIYSGKTYWQKNQTHWQTHQHFLNVCCILLEGLDVICHKEPSYDILVWLAF